MNAPLARDLPAHVRKSLETVTLDDKYALANGRAFMSGVQALVRLPMLQRVRDMAAGLNTAGLSAVTGVLPWGATTRRWLQRKNT